LPSKTQFEVGLGLRGDYFASGLTLLTNPEGRIAASSGSKVVIKLQEGWKQRCRQNQSSPTGREVILQGQLYPASGKIISASEVLQAADEESEEAKILLQYLHRRVEWAYDTTCRPRQHHITLELPAESDTKSYLLRILWAATKQETPRLLLEYWIEVCDNNGAYKATARS